MLLKDFVWGKIRVTVTKNESNCSTTLSRTLGHISAVWQKWVLWYEWKPDTHKQVTHFNLFNQCLHKKLTLYVSTELKKFTDAELIQCNNVIGAAVLGHKVSDDSTNCSSADILPEDLKTLSLDRMEITTLGRFPSKGYLSDDRGWWLMPVAEIFGRDSYKEDDPSELMLIRKQAPRSLRRKLQPIGSLFTIIFGKNRSISEDILSWFDPLMKEYLKSSRLST